MELPKRKHIRLKDYDYSQDGYYFVTIHTLDNRPLLSTVGRGLAPAETIRLLPLGEVAEQQLIALEQRFSYIKIDCYVIMPTHIHAILILSGQAAGASPRPTLPDIMGAYKSLTTRIANQRERTAGRRIFQVSYYETVIRNGQSYAEIRDYIEKNPFTWLETEKTEG